MPKSNSSSVRTKPKSKSKGSVTEATKRKRCQRARDVLSAAVTEGNIINHRDDIKRILRELVETEGLDDNHFDCLTGDDYCDIIIHVTQTGPDGIKVTELDTGVQSSKLRDQAAGSAHDSGYGASSDQEAEVEEDAGDQEPDHLTVIYYEDDVSMLNCLRIRC